MIMECIKGGFDLANRNLQLVIVRLITAAINLISLLVFLGVPLMAAAAYLGFDLARAEDFLPHLIREPSAFLSRYLGLVFLIGISFVFYLVFSSVIILYSLGGALGVLRNSALDALYKFSLSSFFSEANRNFSRLFRLVFVMSVFFMLLAFVLIVTGGIASALLNAFQEGTSFLEVFLGSFIMMSIMVFGAMIFAVYLMLIVYSMIVSVTEGKGAADSVKRAFNFLKEKPRAFLLFIVLFAGVAVLNLLLFALRAPFGLVPFVGIMMTLMIAVFQNYFAVVMWSALTACYIRWTKHPLHSATYEI
ncbi:MAG: hypothetical protein C4560_05940 [Nitrospiraceae bacterium]|nr:MAG: hypothetical protein C4560_05940 [Nitrospiraceae bacterium]